MFLAVQVWQLCLIKPVIDLAQGLMHVTAPIPVSNNGGSTASTTRLSTITIPLFNDDNKSTSAIQTQQQQQPVQLSVCGDK